jgi:hypothetical protein
LKGKDESVRKKCIGSWNQSEEEGEMQWNSVGEKIEERDKERHQASRIERRT